MRLWVAYMLWLHGDVSIKLPSLNANHGALHQRFLDVRKQIHSVDAIAENRTTCPQLFMELFLESCSQSDTAAGGLKPVLFSKQFAFTELEERCHEGKQPALLQASTSADFSLKRKSQEDGSVFPAKCAKSGNQIAASASIIGTLQSWLSQSAATTSLSQPTNSIANAKTTVPGPKFTVDGSSKKNNQVPSDSTWATWEKLMCVNIDGTGSWLVKRKVNGVYLMFCTLCEHRLLEGSYRGAKFESNSFTSGCGNFKKESINRHKHSAHKHDFGDSGRTSLKVSGAIVQGFEKCQDLEEVRVKHIIGECAYLAKKDHALNSIADRVKSISYQLEKSLGTAYVNNHMARNFIGCIAHVVASDTIRDINASPFKSIILDESHDKGHLPQLSICIRYLKQGRGYTVFYRLCDF